MVDSAENKSLRTSYSVLCTSYGPGIDTIREIWRIKYEVRSTEYGVRSAEDRGWSRSRGECPQYVSRETTIYLRLPVSRETRILKIGFTWNGQGWDRLPWRFRGVQARQLNEMLRTSQWEPESTSQIPNLRS